MNAAIALPENERLIRESELEALCAGVEGIDARILAAIIKRTELVRRIAHAERTAGRTTSSYQAELAVVDRFGSLGREGLSLGRLLNRLAKT